MQLFRLNGSLKNIPIAGRFEYKEKLIEQAGKLMRRMRLKAHFLEKGKQGERKETFGFKSLFTPEKVSKNLIAFERDLTELVANVEFRKTNSSFQNELRKDVERIKKCPNVIVAADKTSNFYELPKEEYIKLLNDNITASYKKASSDAIYAINREAKKVTKDLDIADRIHKIPLKEAFVTLKDHKVNFNAAPKCRLINPTKSNVGRIAKVKLDDINREIRSKTKLLQWTDTDQMLEWFSKLDGTKYSLMKFDVVEFYPSISQKLLNKAMKFAEKYVDIEPDVINIINNSCKSILHSRGEVWVKKTKQEEDFDVAMGSYSGAETCELIGLYMLHGLEKIFGEGMVGLYRDDGLAAIPIQSGSKTEKLKAAVHRLVKGIGLKVTVEAPLRRTDFLDVQLDLTTMTFAPFRKPNSRTMYVNAKSNHPKCVLASIPKSVNDRLIKRSSDEKQFNENKADYERALKDAGYIAELKYQKLDSGKRRNRRRNITWFNPPYCASVKTNIGRKFINLVRKHFSKSNPLRKIFNPSSMRVSYCCMNNIGDIIKAHNAKILREGHQEADKPCNCTTEECPFKGKGISCNATNVIYKAVVKTQKDSRFYIGLSEPEFKKRYKNHTSSFNLDRELKRMPTKLATHVRTLKKDKKHFEIDWSVIGRTSELKDGDATCRLCIREATAIVFADDDCLNQRNEIANSCRHKKKFLLKFLDTPG